MKATQRKPDKFGRNSSMLLAPRAGLEPATRCLEGSRSIQLSYRGEGRKVTENRGLGGIRSATFLPLGSHFSRIVADLWLDSFGRDASGDQKSVSQRRIGNSSHHSRGLIYGWMIQVATFANCQSQGSSRRMSSSAWSAAQRAHWLGIRFRY